MEGGGPVRARAGRGVGGGGGGRGKGEKGGERTGARRPCCPACTTSHSNRHSSSASSGERRCRRLAAPVSRRMGPDSCPVLLGPQRRPDSVPSLGLHDGEVVHAARLAVPVPPPPVLGRLVERELAFLLRFRFVMPFSSANCCPSPSACPVSLRHFRFFVCRWSMIPPWSPGSPWPRPPSSRSGRPPRAPPPPRPPLQRRRPAGPPPPPPGPRGGTRGHPIVR